MRNSPPKDISFRVWVMPATWLSAQRSSFRPGSGRPVIPPADPKIITKNLNVFCTLVVNTALMSPMRKYLLVIFVLMQTLTAIAQDPNFSQFFVSPLTLNPALTGKFNGDFRAAG